MALLLACGVTATYVLWTLDQRTQAAVTAQADVSAQLARMTATTSDIGAAQQSYVAPGQLDEPWFERTATLVEQLTTDIEQTRSGLRSPEAAAAAPALAASLEALMAADARTRQNLRLGQELMASDVIFSDGRNVLDAMTGRLRDLRAAEQATHLAELASLTRGRWIALAATALLWVAGLLALVTVPASPGFASPVSAAATPAVPHVPVGVAPLVPVALSADTQRGSLDLAAAASLCTDLSRVTTTTALPDLLARAARVLDASGLILWMSAGDQIVPVLGHGYRPDTLARLGPITRDADNAAADAWRTGRLTLVQADGTGHGAIVAPLFGLRGCIGVLAAEVPQGAESNTATQAVATMIAAQLATVIPTWPADGLAQPHETARAARSA